MTEAQTWDVEKDSPEAESAHAWIRAAALACGYRAESIQTLRARDPRKRGRSAHRVDLVGGGCLKARVLESATAVRDLLAHRQGLDPAFAAALGGHRRVVLEAWVQGEQLSPRDADERIEEAAALLGRLHAAGAPHRTGATQHWRERADADLAELTESGDLLQHELTALRDVIATHDPGRAPLVITHRDFCPENMRIGRDGALRVIDNERFDFAPPGFDVGRTLYRWPMSHSQQQRFLAAYANEFELDREPLLFWIAASILLSARVRRDHARQRLAVPLAAARAFAAEPARMLAVEPPL